MIQKYTEASQSPADIMALVLSSQDGYLADLENVFRTREWKMRCVPSVKDGISTFLSMAPVIVICDDQLDDGDWRVALDAVNKAERPSPMIVTSRNADDRMWAEVLNRGGYDLLAKPYDTTAVVNVVGSAWRWINDRISGRKSASMSQGA